jgi:hypothetical protein
VLNAGYSPPGNPGHRRDTGGQRRRNYGCVGAAPFLKTSISSRDCEPLAFASFRADMPPIHLQGARHLRPACKINIDNSALEPCRAITGGALDAVDDPSFRRRRTIGLRIVRGRIGRFYDSRGDADITDDEVGLWHHQVTGEAAFPPDRHGLRCFFGPRLA